MAWSTRGKGKWSPPEESEGADSSWIYRQSVEESRANLREALKKDGIESSEVDFVLMQLAHVACMRGRTRKVAPLVVQFMERREEKGIRVWLMDDGIAPLLGVSMVRLIAAYFEDPAIPRSRARAVCDHFLRSLEPYACLVSVAKIVPMILAVRADLGPVQKVGIGKRASSLPLKRVMEASGLCVAAHRQWKVEYLLAVGEEDEALDLAHRGRAEKPCGVECALAPHSMYAWLLEPLHRRGQINDARALQARLEGLVGVRLLYLDSIGCQIHFHCLEGAYEKAALLLHPMLRLATDPEASPWHRLKFYESCTRAIEVTPESAHETLLGNSDSTLEEVRAHIITERDALREAFANRED